MCDLRPGNVVRPIEGVFFHRFVVGHFGFHIGSLDQRNQGLYTLRSQLRVQVFQDLGPFGHRILVVCLPNWVVILGVFRDRVRVKCSVQLQAEC